VLVGNPTVARHVPIGAGSGTAEGQLQRTSFARGDGEIFATGSDYHAFGFPFTGQLDSFSDKGKHGLVTKDFLYGERQCHKDTGIGPDLYELVDGARLVYGPFTIPILVGHEHGMQRPMRATASAITPPMFPSHRAKDWPVQGSRGRKIWSPDLLPDVAGSISLGAKRHLKHRLLDPHVAGAAANVTAQHFFHLLFAGIGISFKKIRHRHQNTRRTVTALQRVIFFESRLKDIKLSIAIG